MSEITVLGIFVADISFSGPKIPSIGETILGKKYNVGPGGKGCNQAIAISRLGGKTNFISKIGKDSYGELALKTLEKNKISTKNVIQDSNQQTGVAGILVDQNTGKNAINVIVGAPSSLKVNEIEKQIDLIKSSKIFLTQLEVPKDVTLHCLKTAKENGCITILNPAPASEISKEFYNNIDFFTPNETEAEFYLNKKIETEKDIKIASEEFLKKGIKNIVITLGEKGCYFANDKENFFMNAFKLKEPVVDTTGAGDAFNGALAVGLSKDLDIKEVLSFANKVGAISTTKQGAAASMPSMEDLNNY